MHVGDSIVGEFYDCLNSRQNFQDVDRDRVSNQSPTVFPSWEERVGPR